MFFSIQWELGKQGKVLLNNSLENHLATHSNYVCQNSERKFYKIILFSNYNKSDCSG